eukprot:jgi/Galph1/3835/GphlegSOOS_G2454.1
MLRVGRLDYFFRPLFYLVVFFVFFQVVRLQLFTAPSHKRKRRFGGKLVFLTVQTNFILITYNFLALITSCLRCFLSENQKYRWFNKLESFIFQLNGLAFPSGAFMGIGYYTLIHFHKQVREVAKQVKNFDNLMHLLHGFPLIYVLLDALFYDPSLVEKYQSSFWKEAQWSLSFAAFYFCWTFLCAYMNDWDFPYPFQHELSAVKQVIFYSVVFAVVSILVWFGREIRGSLHWKRWKYAKRAEKTQ